MALTFYLHYMYINDSISFPGKKCKKKNKNKIKYKYRNKSGGISENIK